MTPSFLPAFDRLRNTCPDKFELVGDCLIVEVLPHSVQTKEVKGADGRPVHLVLASGERKQIDGLEMNLPIFCRVLAVGNGFYDESKDEESERQVDLDVKPGDIVLVGPMAIKRLSAFGPLVSTSDRQLAITRESEIQLRFVGEDGYAQCAEALRETIAEPKSA